MANYNQCSLLNKNTNTKKEENKIATSEAVYEINAKGAFVRQNNRFTTPFGTGEGELLVEANRYHLLWAHRSVIVRKLLGPPMFVFMLH